MRSGRTVPPVRNAPKLARASVLGLRDDKDPKECTFDELDPRLSFSDSRKT